MSILNALSPYKLLIEVAVIGSLIVGAGVAAHNAIEAHDERVRNVVVAEYEKKLSDAKAAALAQERSWQTIVTTAQTQGANREVVIRNLAASSGAASVSLRDTLASIRNGVPSATVEALRNSTTTLAAVLTDCQGRYRDMAEKADRHANDARTLYDAWPTDQVASPK